MSTGTDRGSAVVATLTLSFVLITGSLVWLSTTIDGSLHARTQAQAVAFQAARAGAQAIERPDPARPGVLVIDPVRARAAATGAVQRLLAVNGDSGSLTTIRIDGPRVTVAVSVTSGGRTVSGVATATAHAGFDRPDQ